jgi:hypothetical protein
MRSFRVLILLPLILVSSGCNDSGDTIIVNNSDCGLIRTDLLGTYTVAFAPVTADLINCSDPQLNGGAVTVTSTPRDFASVQVFASAFNTGFAFNDGAAPENLFGNAETDSCGMSFSVLDNEGVYLNCFGTLDRASGLVHGACDSTAVLQIPVVNPVTVLGDCDLDPILQVTLTIH